MTAVENMLLAYVINAAWQAVVVGGLAWCLARAARRLGAGVEHRIWVAALAVEVLLPALAHPLAFLPGSTAAGDSGFITVTSTVGVARSTGGLPAGVVSALLLLFAGAVGVAAMRLVLGIRRTMHTARRATPVLLTDEQQAAWDRCRAAFGVSASLRQSPDVEGPGTLGTLRPLLLLPCGFLEAASAPEFFAALAHECAHIERRDFAWNLFYKILALPIAWHPAVWMTQARLAEAREILCDAMAAKVVAGKRDYARALLRLASGMAGHPAQRDLYTVGIFDGHNLEERMMRLTEPTMEVRTVRRLLTVAACIAAAIGTCAGASALRIEIAAPAQASAPQAVRIPGDVMATNIQSKVAPRYPEEAKAKHISGTVVIRALIGKDGLMRGLEVVSGPEELRESAMDAVRQWIYRPYLLNGEPTEVDTTITVNYSLQSSPPPPPPSN